METTTSSQDDTTAGAQCLTNGIVSYGNDICTDCDIEHCNLPTPAYLSYRPAGQKTKQVSNHDNPDHTHVQQDMEE